MIKQYIEKVLMKVLAWLAFIFNMLVMAMLAISIILYIAEKISEL